ARVRVQRTTRRDERFSQTRIEKVTAEPECGGRKFLETRRLIAQEPCDFAMLQRAFEKRREPKSRNRSWRESRDELAAHAVPRIIAGFEKRHGYRSPAQSKTEREPGQSAADDFNG